MTLATVAAVLSVVSIVSMAVAVPMYVVSFFEMFSRSKSSGADTAAHWLTVVFYFAGLAAVLCWIVLGLQKVFG